MDFRDADWFVTEPPDPPNQGIMFVNHAEAGRSGHLGHALVEYLPGKILAFYANCSDCREGHNGGGRIAILRLFCFAESGRSELHFGP